MKSHQLNAVAVRAVTTSIYRYFLNQDNPPADEIHEPIDAVKLSDDQYPGLTGDVYTATVRFVTNYCERKVHTVRIAFELTPTGHFNSKTFQYI